MSGSSCSTFAVLITVYFRDCDEWFREALDSVTLKQTLQPNQLVLVVDGPIGESKNKIIQEYEDLFEGEFTTVRLPKNVGQGASLNIGLGYCKHNLVCRMDSDDISLPRRFEVLLSFMQENENIDVASSAIEEFDLNGVRRIRKLPTTHEKILSYSKLRSPINHGACIFKKTSVVSVGGYSGLFQLQDYLLFARMINSGYSFANINEILVKVRIADEYYRKSGLNYFKEEVKLARILYKEGFLNIFQFARNIIVRGLPRLTGKLLISSIYKYVIR